MRTPSATIRRVLLPVLSVGLLASLTGWAGCADPQADLTGVDLRAAKGGNGKGGGKGGGGDGGDVIVDATDPSSAPQDTILDVVVTGSGFDDGSIVEFELEGAPAEKVRANSTQFVDASTVVANVTIDADADPTLYDVVVQTARGRRGIGIELFEVTCAEWDSGKSSPKGCVALSGGYETPAASPLPTSFSIQTKGRYPMITFLETQDGAIEITVPNLTEATANALCRASSTTPGFDETSTSDIAGFWNGTHAQFPYPRGAVTRNFFAKVDLTANGQPHQEHRSHGLYWDENQDGVRWNYRVGTSLDDFDTGEPLWPGVLSSGLWNGDGVSPVVTISGGVISLSRTNGNTGERIRVSCLNQGALAVDFVIDRCDDDNTCR